MSGHDKQIDYRAGNDSYWSQAYIVPAALAVLGLVFAVLGGIGTDRFGYSYLFGLFTTLTLVLGAIFLVLIQFLSVGHWGITTRRIMEVVMSGMPIVAVFALLFFGGVMTGQFTMYDEWIGVSSHGAHGDEHGDVDGGDEHGSLALGAGVAHAQDDDHGEVAGDHGGDHADGEEHARTPQETRLHHEILAKKAAYLNKRGWLVRGIFYLLLLCIIALGYFRWSRSQDETKDPALTRKMQSFSAVGLIVFAMVLTFAAFDWLMSLEPSWYSTIFGVVIFAGSAVAILAFTTLVGLSLYQRGLVGDAINPEHFHDLGKLMFGFICFWTYVHFSQWMLIWYAGIPEEATWFHKRWEGGWSFVSLLLILGHFVAPFVLLISRVQKRALRWLQLMCIWVLFMHAVDIFWFVLPQAGQLSVQLSDIGCLLLIGGTFVAYVFWQLGRVPLIPIGDPRLARSIHHHQTH